MEATLNSRPLMYLAADDIQEPLTPARLLTGHRLLGLSGSQMLATQDVDFMIFSDHSSVTWQMEHTQHLLEHFWRHWRNEYLSHLRGVRSYAAVPCNGKRSVTLGDICSGT